MGVQGIELEGIVDELVSSHTPEQHLDEPLDEGSKDIIAKVDRRGSTSYGLIVGGTLDYFTGLGLMGIAISRLSATTMNYVAGGLYGQARELAYRMTGTSDDSHWVRRTLVELLPFNAIQPATTALAVAIGCFVSEGTIDLEKVKGGALNMALYFPLIAPAMGFYLDLFRRLCGVQSAAEGAYTREMTQSSSPERVVDV